MVLFLFYKNCKNRVQIGVNHLTVHIQMPLCQIKQGMNNKGDRNRQNMKV